jgi:hypothetical protein
MNTLSVLGCGAWRKILEGEKGEFFKKLQRLSKPFHPTLAVCFHPLSESFERL